mgnify:CR=1 FL=1
MTVSSVAVVGAVLASVPSVNATLTATLLSVQAVPFASFTKSRPLDNSSWIMYWSSLILYTYESYPVVSGIAPVTVYVTTWPISAVSLSTVLLMLGASVFKFTVLLSASTVTKEDWISFPPVTYTR